MYSLRLLLKAMRKASRAFDIAQNAEYNQANCQKIQDVIMTSTISDFIPKRAPAQTASSRALAKMAQSLNIPIAVQADLSKWARTGLPTHSFVSFSQVGFTRKELEWIIPPRTFTHRQKDQGVLTLEESDKLLRAAKINALAIEVLGNEAKALAWLHKERSLFNRLSAMELIKTEHGAQLVEEALIQLDEGYF